MDKLTYVGSVEVDSGQVMIGDPAYLNNWDTNQNDVWDIDNKIGQYSYHGAAATMLSDKFGELGESLAVVSQTAFGDGRYPVYARVEDDVVQYLVVDFVGKFEKFEEKE